MFTEGIKFDFSAASINELMEFVKEELKKANVYEVTSEQSVEQTFQNKPGFIKREKSTKEFVNRK